MDRCEIQKNPWASTQKPSNGPRIHTRTEGQKILQRSQSIPGITSHWPFQLPQIPSFVGWLVGFQRAQSVRSWHGLPVVCCQREDPSQSQAGGKHLHEAEGMNCSAMQLWKKNNPVCHLVAAHKSPAPRQHTIRWTPTRVTDGPIVYPAI